MSSTTTSVPFGAAAKTTSAPKAAFGKATPASEEDKQYEFIADTGTEQFLKTPVGQTNATLILRKRKELADKERALAEAEELETRKQQKQLQLPQQSSSLSATTTKKTTFQEIQDLERAAKRRAGAGGAPIQTRGRNNNDDDNDNEPEPAPMPPMPAELSGEMEKVTLASLALRLRRDNSAVRRLFLEALRRNFAQWRARIEMRRQIIGLRGSDNSAASSSGQRRRGGGGGGGGDAKDAMRDDLKEIEQFSDELILERARRFEQRLMRQPGESEAVKMAEALEQFDNLIGLTTLKASVARLVVSNWIANQNVSLFGDHRNILLFGSPGTGKTESAAKLRKILGACGILLSDDPTPLGSYTRSSLVAAYAGASASKTARAFAESWGDLLFIDEAYTLQSGKEDSFGLEAIDSIVERTETLKGEVIVIAAGYEQLVRQRFLASNAGLPSRFPYQWQLGQYRPIQLFRILFNNITQENPAAKIDEPALTSSSSSPTETTITTTTTTTTMARPATSEPQAISKILGMALDQLANVAPPQPPAPLNSSTGQAIASLLRLAHGMSFFVEQNARGARNFGAAIEEQRKTRIFASILDKRQNESIQTSTPIELVDVYRGFKQWMKTTFNVDVYFLDSRVETLLSK